MQAQNVLDTVNEEMSADVQISSEMSRSFYDEATTVSSTSGLYMKSTSSHSDFRLRPTHLSLCVLPRRLLITDDKLQ